MVSKHTIHHSKSKWGKASGDKKAISKLQRKINAWKNKHYKLLIRYKARLNQIRLFSKACNKLVDDGIVEREFFSPYMPKFKDVIEKIKDDKSVKRRKNGSG